MGWEENLVLDYLLQNVSVLVCFISHVLLKGDKSQLKLVSTFYSFLWQSLYGSVAFASPEV